MYYSLVLYWVEICGSLIFPMHCTPDNSTSLWPRQCSEIILPGSLTLNSLDNLTSPIYWCQSFTAYYFDPILRRLIILFWLNKIYWHYIWFMLQLYKGKQINWPSPIKIDNVISIHTILVKYICNVVKYITNNYNTKSVKKKSQTHLDLIALVYNSARNYLQSLI